MRNATTERPDLDFVPDPEAPNSYVRIDVPPPFYWQRRLAWAALKVIALVAAVLLVFYAIIDLASWSRGESIEIWDGHGIVLRPLPSPTSKVGVYAPANAYAREAAVTPAPPGTVPGLPDVGHPGGR